MYANREIFALKNALMRIGVTLEFSVNSLPFDN